MTYPELREIYFEQLLKNPTNKEALENTQLQILGKTSNPKHLYKYCNIETALKILTTGSLLLQAPDNFNDPFDCLARVGTWDSGTQFGASKQDIDYLKELIKEIPQQFQLPEYRISNDLRTSFSFAITCFTSNHTNPLMWSHYSKNHKGICLEFEINSILKDLHPCFYTDSMPKMGWRTDNINLSLIKESAWQYEDEWRLVKKTIRPRMRLFADITNQIYVAIHKDSRYSQKDQEEWGNIQSSLIKRLEKTYNDECIISIKPSRVFLGLLFEHNYANEITGDTCRKIIAFTRDNNISLNKILPEPKSFKLSDTIADNLPNWY